jgi:ATP adenylyltransferase/5',5'''-P-1,P-4-tetraphosphate phosphorylase II
MSVFVMGPTQGTQPNSNDYKAIISLNLPFFSKAARLCIHMATNHIQTSFHDPPVVLFTTKVSSKMQRIVQTKRHSVLRSLSSR